MSVEEYPITTRQRMEGEGKEETVFVPCPLCAKHRRRNFTYVASLNLPNFMTENTEARKEKQLNQDHPGSQTDPGLPGPNHTPFPCALSSRARSG